MKSERELLKTISLYCKDNIQLLLIDKLYRVTVAKKILINNIELLDLIIAVIKYKGSGDILVYINNLKTSYRERLKNLNKGT